VGYLGPLPDVSNHSFAFKCHRDSDHAYAVNSLHFHPQVRQESPLECNVCALSFAVVRGSICTLALACFHFVLCFPFVLCHA
jgi:hypothetical protein